VLLDVLPVLYILRITNEAEDKLKVN